MSESPIHDQLAVEHFAADLAETTDLADLGWEA
jgi:hypothetical protein